MFSPFMLEVCKCIPSDFETVTKNLIFLATNLARRERRRLGMFQLLFVAAASSLPAQSAELDAAQGYGSIYGTDGASSALASIHVPSVPWG